ncbi:MAG: low molecular weight protein arginine phosphatase [Deltaproteobacteria bacterium]|nr:low molecular weight protein arginine phosphatase [Deltaproteobacteria bacterium]
MPSADPQVPFAYRKILFICHANTSRSIIAEALLKKMLRERALHDHLAVESGGIAAYARDGALVSLDARLVLRDEGIHISPDSVSTDLKRNRHMVADADLILAMTTEQVHMIRNAFPEAEHKPVFTLKEFAGGHGDIEDPAGRDENFFAACRDEIKACLERAVERLAPVSNGE